MASNYVPDIKRKMEKNSVLFEIIDILQNEKLSIAELQRRINMKRSTLIYYLKELESKGFLKRERIEKKKTGRPTLLIWDNKAWRKASSEFAEKRNKEYQETNEKILNLPETKKVLEVIGNNPQIDLSDLLSHKSIINLTKKFAIINWLHEQKLIKESFSLTEHGKKVLKQKK